MFLYRSNSCCVARSWVVLVAAVVASAQEPKPPQEIRLSAKPYAPAPVPMRVETNLIEVGVVVRNHDGRAIHGLKRENFVVTDQGSSRELTYFAIETPGLRPEKPPTAVAAGDAATPSAGANTEQPTAATPHPRFIILYFDDFGTNNADLKRAQVAGRRFVNEGLEDTDHVALFSSSGDFLDYTADQAKLIDAIDKLRSHPKFSEIGLGGCPRISPYAAYQISVMLDRSAIDAAIQEAATCNSSGDDSQYIRAKPRVKTAAELEIQSQAELLWGQVRVASQSTLDAIGHALSSLQVMPGRRLFLLVSSGFNSATLEPERDQLISQALRAGIVISSVDAKGLYAEVPGRDASDGISVTNSLPFQTFRYETSSIGSKLITNNQVMSDLAQATGGLFFRNNNDLPHGFRQLGSIPEVSYVLGFHRQDTAADGKYHKLKVTLRESNSYVIQARPGYFATPPAPSAQSDPLQRQRELDRQVSDISMRADFPASVAFRLDRAPTAGMVTVKTQIHVAIDKLQFPIKDERRMQHLRFCCK